MFYDFNLYSCRLGREDRATSSNHLHDPRLLAIAAVDHQVLEAQHDDYVHSSISGTAFFRFSALLVSIFLSSLVKIFYASHVPIEYCCIFHPISTSTLSLSCGTSDIVM